MAALTAHLLQQLSRQKLAEAKALHAAGFFAGSWYVGGYVVELALKAAVCRTLSVTEYPETALPGNPFKTHRLPDLILLAGLQAELGTKLLAGSAFQRNWSTVSDWRPEDRYGATRTQGDAERLIEALQDPSEGVLTWLTNRW